MGKEDQYKSIPLKTNSTEALEFSKNLKAHEQFHQKKHDWNAGINPHEERQGIVADNAKKMFEYVGVDNKISTNEPIK